MKIVLDTVIYVRSLLNPRSRWGRIVFEHANDYTLIVSEPVVREILEVIHRPEIARRFRFLADMDIHRVLDLLVQAEIVELQGVPRVSRDPKDDMFLATARAANADFIVSEDKDLVLGLHEGIPILDGTTFLQVLGANT